MVKGEKKARNALPKVPELRYQPHSRRPLGQLVCCWAATPVAATTAMRTLVRLTILDDGSLVVWCLEVR